MPRSRLSFAYSLFNRRACGRDYQTSGPMRFRCQGRRQIGFIMPPSRNAPCRPVIYLLSRSEWFPGERVTACRGRVRKKEIGPSARDASGPCQNQRVLLLALITYAIMPDTPLSPAGRPARPGRASALPTAWRPPSLPARSTPCAAPLPSCAHLQARQPRLSRSRG